MRWETVVVLCSKFIQDITYHLCQNEPSFVEDVTKTFWLTFSWTRCISGLLLCVQSNLSEPLHIEDIDSSSGLLIPFFDADTNVVFVAGKVL